jgi:hypothetical protein
VKIFLEDKQITYHVREVEMRKEEIVTLLEVIYIPRERSGKTLVSHVALYCIENQTNSG